MVAAALRVLTLVMWHGVVAPAFEQETRKAASADNLK